MKIRSLTIRRMPGFEDRGFALEGLSEGLNIIVGPNASGKTTACEAIRGLLWPETLRDASPVSLVGEWQEDGKLVRLELEADRLMCQIDGEPADPPPLPGSHLANCFTVTIDGLFEDSRTDSDLAARVVRHMAGGYDLAAVRELDEFSISRRHGRSDLEAFRQAQRTVREIQAEHENLRAEEDELENLRRQEAEARSAQARLNRLDDVRQLMAVSEDIRQARSLLESFPDGMDRLRGNEDEILRQVQQDWDTAQGELEEAGNAAEKAKEQLSQADLPAEGISDARLDEQSTRLEQLRTLEQRMEELRRQITEARAEMGGALGLLGDAAEPDALDTIDLSGLDDLDAFHRGAEQLKARQAALDARLATLGDDEAPEDIDTLAAGIGILRQWFEAPAPTEPIRDKNRILAWALAALMGMVGIALGIVLSPWWAFLLVVAIAAAVIAAISKTVVQSDLRQMCQERYARLPLESPASWDPQTVGKHLSALEQSLSRAHQAREHQAERRSLRSHLDQLGPQAEELVARRVELTERFGVSPSTSDLALVVLATNLRAYREAHATLVALHTELDRLRENHETHLGQVNAYLTELGEEDCDSYEIAHVRSDAVDGRTRLHREASAHLDTAERTMTSAGERIEELKHRRTELFSNLGLAEGDESGLAERLARLSDFEEAVARGGQLEAQQAALRSRLADAPELQEMTIEQVDMEAARLGALAGTHQPLIEKIANIRNRVHRTGRETRLEDALAEMDQCRERLAQRREEVMLAAAGKSLLDQVEAEHKVQSQPGVLRQARQWVSAFTRGRYELLVGEGASGQTAFRALDTPEGRGLDLRQLSRGTRMQLLLAARLAFAADAEQGTQLPFVLDEVLSSTDPIRFRAVIECLLALAHEGRQILYFTCQPADANAWREIASEGASTDTKDFDLAVIQRLERAAAVPWIESAARYDCVPEPAEMSLAEYGRAIGIPAFDPVAGVRGLHVGYLVEDTHQLYQMLLAGIEKYGQLLSLAGYGRADAYLPSEALARVQARASVVEAVCQAWRTGRGRPVNREALSEAGISDNFIDRVTDLAQDLDWDAARLVEALDTREDERAKGFRRSALESIVEGLMASGHLDTRDILGEEQALSRVLAAANEDVKAGRITIEEVRELFTRFWAMCDTSSTIEQD